MQLVKVLVMHFPPHLGPAGLGFGQRLSAIDAVEIFASIWPSMRDLQVAVRAQRPAAPTTFGDAGHQLFVAFSARPSGFLTRFRLSSSRSIAAMSWISVESFTVQILPHSVAVDK
jgi:hypothetical protein